MAKVSVLVNCYNGERYIQDAIASIYNQTFQDWEIIFIDNASTDNTPNLVQHYDHRFFYYRTNKTIPLYAARNYGLQYTKGKFIAFLDSDDIWHPEKLAKQLEVLDKHPTVHLVCSGFYRWHERLNKVKVSKLKHSGVLSLSRVLNNYPICLSTAIIRNQATLKFNDELNLTGDYQLFVKLTYQYETFYIAEPLITLRVHSSNLSSKLISDFPKEIAIVHAAFIKELSMNDKEKSLLDKTYQRAYSIMCLANKEFKKARINAKRNLFKDRKQFIIYIASFNSWFSNLLLRYRGR